MELLFSNKPAHRSWAWQELLGARQCFLTLRCESWASVRKRISHDDLLKQMEREVSVAGHGYAWMFFGACMDAIECFEILAR